jgi:hypothetical protein
MEKSSTLGKKRKERRSPFFLGKNGDNKLDAFIITYFN